MNLFYEYSILAGAVTTSVLALCLFFVKPPKEEIFRVYRRAKIMLGAGYASFAIGILLFVLLPIREIFSPAANAWNLTYYFAAAFLFGSSFISLLTPSFCNKRRMMRYTATYILYVALLWILTFTVSEPMLNWIGYIFMGWFIIQTLIMIKVFLVAYRDLRQQLDNNYADATSTFIRWLNISAWLVIVFGIICGLDIFFNRNGIAMLMTCGLGVFIYIYVSFQNYALNLEPIQYASENPIAESAPAVTEAKPVTEETEEPLDEWLIANLTQWIEAGGYCNSDITLDSLSIHIGTNRTYLSNHINRRYGKSFSLWINGMRLDKAKGLMEATPTIKLTEVVKQCGFSSASYFGKLFRATYGVTPSQYKDSLPK